MGQRGHDVQSQFLLALAEGLEQGLLENVRKGKLNWPKDMDIPVLLRKLEADQFSFYPSIFQHIGVFSSVQNISMKQTLKHGLTHTAHHFDSHGVPLVFNPEKWDLEL